MTVARYIPLPLTSRYHCLDPINRDISRVHCTCPGPSGKKVNENQWCLNNFQFCSKHLQDWVLTHWRYHGNRLSMSPPKVSWKVSVTRQQPCATMNLMVSQYHWSQISWVYGIFEQVHLTPTLQLPPCKLISMYKLVIFQCETKSR